MKLQISKSDACRISTDIKSSGCPVADIELVILALFAEGLTEITIRDFHAVYWGLGWPKYGWTSDHWKVFWRLHETSDKRGYYKLVENPAPAEKVEEILEATAPQVVEPPQVVEIALEVPESSLEVSKEDPRETETYKFFEAQLAKGLDRVVARRVSTKNPQWDFEEILSETHLWFSRWGEAGTCDSYILAGKPPSAAVLAHWVNHKVKRCTYKEALNPVNREFRGLRTQKEIEGRKKTGNRDFLMHGAEKCDPDTKVVWVKSNDETPATPVAVSPEPPSFDLPPEAELVSKALDICNPRTNGLYSKVWEMSLQGASDFDMASRLDFDEVKIPEVRNRVRNSVRSQVGPVIETAKRILEILAEEPFSTFDEIEVTAGDKAGRALSLLLAGKLVEEAPGKSFACTDTGKRGILG